MSIIGCDPLQVGRGKRKPLWRVSLWAKPSGRVFLSRSAFRGCLSASRGPAASLRQSMGPPFGRQRFPRRPAHLEPKAKDLGGSFMGDPPENGLNQHINRGPARKDTFIRTMNNCSGLASLQMGTHVRNGFPLLMAGWVPCQCSLSAISAKSPKPEIQGSRKK